MVTKVTLTPEQKQAAKEEAERTRTLMASADVQDTVAMFGPRFQELERSVVNICIETGELVGGMIGACDIPATADGKKRLGHIVKACTTNSYLVSCANLWASVILGETGDMLFGEGDLAHTIANMTELRTAAKEANKKLGVKSRGRKEKTSATVLPLVGADIWPAVATIIGTQAGRSRLRKLLNEAGFEIIKLSTSGKAKLTASKAADALNDALTRKVANG